MQKVLNITKNDFHNLPVDIFWGIISTPEIFFEMFSNKDEILNLLGKRLMLGNVEEEVLLYNKFVECFIVFNDFEKGIEYSDILLESLGDKEKTAKLINVEQHYGFGLYSKGLCFLKQKKHTEALKFLNESNIIKGNVGITILSIGICHKELGNEYRGNILIQRGLTLLGENEEVIALLKD